MDKKLLIFAIILSICSCTRVDITPSEERVKYYTMYDSRSLNLEDLESSLDSVIIAKDRFHEGLLKMAIGKRYRNKSQFNEAMNLFESTQNIAHELSDTLMLIKSYNEFGTAFRRIDALDEATKAHYEALRYCELYSDQSTYFVKKQKTIALNGIGNISLVLEFYDKAEETFRECLEIEGSLGSDIGLAINYANLGAIYDAKDERDSAMYYYNLSLDHNIKAKSQIGISLCNNYLGNLYEESGEFAKAKEYYIKGYEIIEDHSDIWHKLVLHTSIARINIKQSEYREGVENLEQAYKYAEEVSSPEHLAIIYKIWADYYEAIGDADSALKNLKKSFENADANRRKKEQEALMQSNVNFVTDLFREHAELQDATIKQHKKIQNLLSCIVAGCVLALIIFVYMLSMVRSRNRRLQELNRLKDRFMRVISHDIKNPLTSQKTVLEMMVSNIDYLKTEDIKMQCNDLLRSSGSLLNLLHNLLNWSQIESRTLRYNPTNVDIYMIISEMKEAFNIALAQKEVTIESTIKENTIAYADHNMICTVLRNLLYNAMKYSYVGGNILVSMASENDLQWRINIQDHGVGMSEETKNRLFKLDTSHSNVGTSGEVGTGMGLVIVKEMLAFGSGKIEVDSTEGEGTTISFTIKKGV